MKTLLRINDGLYDDVLAHLLPPEIRGFTTGGVYGGEAGGEHLSFTQGAGHGGSHPHLAHQFIRMLTTGADAYPNVIESANITCTGLLAHESALAGGKTLSLPEWTLRPARVASDG